MPKPIESLGWAPPDGAKVVEPPAPLKAAGWDGGTKPLSEHFNWLFRALTRWIAYLNGLTGEVLVWTALQTFGTAKVTTAPAAANDVARKAEVDAEATARGNADTTLQNNINAEATARGNADTGLQNQINAIGVGMKAGGKFTTPAAAAGAFTIADGVNVTGGVALDNGELEITLNRNDTTLVAMAVDQPQLGSGTAHRFATVTKTAANKWVLSTYSQTDAGVRAIAVATVYLTFF